MNLEAVSRSFKRCVEQPKFLDTFYDRFVQSDPRIRTYFVKTDMVRLKELVREGLELLLMYGLGSIRAKAYVKRIGELHSRKQVGVTPDLYPIWMECLMGTVAEFDPQFDEELDQEWREHLQKGIATMEKLY